MTALSMMDPSAQRNPERVGAENTVTSCDLHVLVYETAESIWRASQIPDTGPNKVRPERRTIYARTAQEVHA